MRAYDSLPASHVLLAVDDRRFRALASTLLSRRGYSVFVCARGLEIAEIAHRENAAAVLLDASGSLTAAARVAARLAALKSPISIVAVSDDAHTGLAALPILPKWGPSEAWLDAVQQLTAATELLEEPASVAS